MSHSYYRARRQPDLPLSSSDLLPTLLPTTTSVAPTIFQAENLPLNPWGLSGSIETTTGGDETTIVQDPSPSEPSPTSQTTTSTTRTPSSPPSATNQRLSPGAITGTAIGVLLGALIFAGLAWLVFHYRRKARWLAAAAARHLNSRNRPKDHSGTAATTWVREKAELPGSEAPVGKLMTPFSWPPIFFFFLFWSPRAA